MGIKNILCEKPAKPLILPSIFGADFMGMGDDVADVVALGVDGLHVDIMDGHFVPNLTMGPLLTKQLRQRFPGVYLDVHLMVTNPENFVQPFADAGANCISYHVEATKGRELDGRAAEFALIDRIRAAGCQAGVVVNPPTDVTEIEGVIDAVDLVLIMSVNPGFSGQAFIPEVLDKVKWCSGRLRDDQRLEMDGGVSPETAPACRAAGCDTIVAASALFGADDRAGVIASLRGEA
ncbi:MAG: ribulose-phosphate 3-epimerase [Planctomycetota bacterium]|jgi:ribulose-phosphate 3-epimerase